MFHFLGTLLLILWSFLELWFRGSTRDLWSSKYPHIPPSSLNIRPSRALKKQDTNTFWGIRLKGVFHPKEKKHRWPQWSSRWGCRSRGADSMASRWAKSSGGVARSLGWRPLGRNPSSERHRHSAKCSLRRYPGGWCLAKAVVFEKCLQSKKKVGKSDYPLHFVPTFYTSWPPTFSRPCLWRKLTACRSCHDHSKICSFFSARRSLITAKRSPPSACSRTNQICPQRGAL